MALCKAVGYHSAGTVEFLANPQRQFFFLVGGGLGVERWPLDARAASGSEGGLWMEWRAGGWLRRC